VFVYFEYRLGDALVVLSSVLVVVLEKHSRADDVKGMRYNAGHQVGGHRR
jgi:hypothetical protein